jgi:hypothetical protein
VISSDRPVFFEQQIAVTANTTSNTTAFWGGRKKDPCVRDVSLHFPAHIP